MKTKIEVVKTLYKSQISSSVRRGHPKPVYTFEWLKNWLLVENDLLFDKIYTVWVSNNCPRWLKPSVDRMNNTKHYTKDNIQLMTWQENLDKSHLDSIKGHINTGREKRAVYKIDQDGVTICLYPSVNIASRDSGIDDSSIIKCCKKVAKTAGTFVWRYENETK